MKFTRTIGMLLQLFALSVAAISQTGAAPMPKALSVAAAVAGAVAGVKAFSVNPNGESAEKPYTPSN